MATANLNAEKFSANDGKDSIIVVRDIADIPGGRTLDVSKWNADTIPAGTIIIKDPTTGEYAPLGLKDDGVTYESTPDASLVGILKKTILKNNPQGAILTAGSVNLDAMPFNVRESLQNALKHIVFIKK